MARGLSSPSVATALARGRETYGRYASGQLTFSRDEPEARPKSSRAVDLEVTGYSTDIMGVLKGRPKAGRGGQRAICRKPSFPKPITRPGRPATSDGRTSISIRLQSQSRTANHRRSTSKCSPVDHNNYLEREAALAPCVTIHDLTTGLPESSSVYIERGAAMAHLEAGGKMQPLSNISSDPAERQRVWKAIEKFEPTGNADGVTINLARAGDIAQAIALDADCPAQLRVEILKSPAGGTITITGLDNTALRKLAERHGCRPPPPADKARKSKARRAANERIEAEKANRPTFEQAGFTFNDGRAGRTQIQGNGELPAELSLAGKERALHRIHHIFASRHLPTVTVMHAPDHNNNELNWHFHFGVYDRPCHRFKNNAEWLDRPEGHAFSKKTEGLARRSIGNPELDKFEGLYDFEVEYTYRKKSRNKVVSTPFAQNKDRLLNHRDYPEALRNIVVDILNDELEREGHKRRYDPRRYSLMGIDKEADDHLDKNASQLEKCGVATKAGLENEARQWDAIVTRLDDEHRSGLGFAATARFKLAFLAGKDERAAPLLNAGHERAVEAVDAMRAAAELEQIIERASSRALSTESHCRRTLKAIDEGKASKRETADRSLYEALLGQAQEHLRQIEHLFRIQRDDVEVLKQQARDAKKTADQFFVKVYDAVFNRTNASSSAAVSPGVSIPTERIPMSAEMENRSTTRLPPDEVKPLQPDKASPVIQPPGSTARKGLMRAWDQLQLDDQNTLAEIERDRRLLVKIEGEVSFAKPAEATLPHRLWLAAFQLTANRLYEDQVVRQKRMIAWKQLGLNEMNTFVQIESNQHLLVRSDGEVVFANPDSAPETHRLCLAAFQRRANSLFATQELRLNNERAAAILSQPSKGIF